MTAPSRVIHTHDVSCAFGNPTCPAFAEPAQPKRRPWWRRVIQPTAPEEPQ